MVENCIKAAPYIFEVQYNSLNNLIIYVTVLAKTCIVYIKTEINFIATVDRHIQYLSIPSVLSVKC